MAAVSQMLPHDLKPRPASLPISKSTSSSKSNSINSSPDTKAVDLRTPIPEEEEEDETGSETANEPVTPTDTHNAHDFRNTSNEALHDSSHNDGSQPSFQQVKSKPPLLLSTAATPPPGAKRESNTVIPVVDSTPPQTPSQSRPASSNQSGPKRGFSGFFRRSNSNMASASATDTLALTHGAGGSDTMLFGNGRRLSTRGLSSRTSPNTTRSNSPHSPGSPTKDGAMLSPSRTTGQEPHANQFLSGKNKNRSSTGLGIRSKIQSITWAKGDVSESLQHTRHRATSVDLENATKQPAAIPAELSRNIWELAPGAGTGMKARRMSLNLPDDFTVDVVDLHSEFSNQSKIIGRRGKNLGKGATSTVALMTRKGFGGELYAVKEFRGKQAMEKEEDYEKKIKSEYSIAKSLHHPNIVETVRLCTDKGTWNHVMEYCEEGDLFSFVQKGYLKETDRASDRLCLFKQLVQGVQYLHCHGIAHRDIKLENLLITKDSKLKITDFGVSEVFSGIHPGLRAAGGECGKEMVEVRRCEPGICGSMPYIAPEVVLKNGDYDPRPLDVWSSAIVMIHIIFGGAIWPKAEERQGYKCYDSLVKGWANWEAKHPEGGSLSEKDYPFVAAFDQMIKPPVLRRILVGMLHPDPAKRSTIEQVANNRWMKNVECCQVNSYDDPSTVIDASKRYSSSTKNGVSKVVLHNHLPPASHKGLHLIRLPGKTDT